MRNLNFYKGNFENLIFEKIVDTRLKPSVDTFKRSLLKGKFLFILDGYDEIFSIRKSEINQQIESFVDTYAKNKFVITTRPGGGIEYFPRFYNFNIIDLSNEKVEGFINKIIKIDERKERILAVIKDNKNISYIEYLRNPLLLSMFILAFESHPEIPNRKSAFYSNVFDTLYSKHDGITKNSFSRERRTKLQRNDFENILNIFSYLSLIKGKYSFTSEYLADTLLKVRKSLSLNFENDDLIDDLRTSISILLLDGFKYSFPHRSLQEYFTAQFISNIPAGKKEKVYKNLSTTLEKSSSDFSFNLWGLCNELDKEGFYTNFLLPSLNSFELSLSQGVGLDIINKFYKLAKPIFKFDYLEKNDPYELTRLKMNRGKKLIVIYREPNFFNSLLAFLHVHDFSVIFHFLEESKADLELAQMYPDEFIHEEVGKNFAYDSDVISILLKYGFVNKIVELRKSINEKIRELEDEISRQTLSIDELLDL